MKRIITLILSLFICFLTYSQYTDRWDKSVYAKSNAEGYKVIKDGSGSIYVLAMVNNGSNNDIVIIKYDKWGKEKWKKTYDNGFDDTPVDIVWSNALYLLGNTKTSSTLTKVWLAKYDSNGVSQWSNVLGGIAGLFANGLDVQNGNPHFVGYQPTGSQGLSLYVAKYNTTGALQWNNSYDKNSLDDKGKTISVSSAGDVYVGGFGTISSTLTVGVILKYNPTGVLQWTKESSGGETNTKDSVIAIQATGLAMSVTIYATGKKYKQFPTSTFRNYISKYNSSGTLQWRDSVNIPSTAQNAEILITGTTNLYVTGYSRPGSGYNGYACKFSTTGSFQWIASGTEQGGAYKGLNLHNSAFPVDDSNNIYINNLSHIRKYNSSGTYVSTVASFSTNDRINHLLIDDLNYGIVLTGLGNEVDSSKYPIRVKNVCIPASKITFTSTDTALCSNSSIQLFGLGAKSYNWYWDLSTNNTYFKFLDSLVQNPIIKAIKKHPVGGGLTVMYFRVDGRDNYQCYIPSDKFYTYTYANAPTLGRMKADELVFSNKDTALYCSGMFLFIDPSGFRNYFYKYKPLQADSLVTPISTSSVNIKSSGRYFSKAGWLQYPNCWSSSQDTILLAHLKVPKSLSWGKDTMACNLSSGLSLTAYSKYGNYYIWSTGKEGTKDDPSFSYAETVTTPQKYWVKVELIGGCADFYDTLDVKDFAKPKLGKDTTITNIQSITLNAGTGYRYYNWNTGGTKRTIFIDGSTIGIGTFPYWVEVSSGSCIKNDTLNLTIVPYVSSENINEKTIAFLYPNPSKDGNFNINFNNAITESVLQITDFSGRVIENIIIPENTKEFKFKIKPIDGYYIITITTNSIVRFRNTIKVD